METNSKTNERHFLVWSCPECGEVHRDEQDPIDGPFLTVTCSNCARSFDQDEVLDCVETEPLAA